MNLVNGNKTYLTAFGIAVVFFLDLANIYPLEQTVAVLGVLGVGSIAAIRHAIEKLERNQ